MNTSQSIDALQRANPRGRAGFAESVEAAGDAVRARVATAGAVSEPRTSFPRGRLLGGVFAPFGNVAHDEAADPSAPLDTALTVGPEGVIRRISVRWGSWRYTVTYRNLGATAAPVAPANPRRLRER
jgi:hypothetical protein